MFGVDVILDEDEAALLGHRDNFGVARTDPPPLTTTLLPAPQPLPATEDPEAFPIMFM